jgi:hypothetical protein
MIQEALFSDKEGSGYISDSFHEIAAICSPHAEPIAFGDTELLPSCETDLEGFYNRPLMYVGHMSCNDGSIFLPDGAIEMVFYAGEHEGKHYFKSVYWITRDRFYIQYQPSGGRDYNRVKGHWDFNRKPNKKTQTTDMTDKRKTKDTAPAEAVEQTNVPAVVIPTGEDYINQAVQDLQVVEGKELIDKQIEALKEQYLGLTVSDLNDRPAYVALADGGKLAKRLRLAVDAKRKELNEFPLKFQRAVNAEAKRITELLAPIEQHCLAEVAKFEQAEAEAKKAEQARKHKELIESGWVYNGTFYVCGPISMTLEQVMRMNEDQWAKAIKHGQDEVARQEAEKARIKAEQDRIRKEAEDIEAEKEQLRKERMEARAEILMAAGFSLNSTGAAYVHTEFKNLFIGVEVVVNTTLQEFRDRLNELKADVQRKKDELAAKPEPVATTVAAEVFPDVTQPIEDVTAPATFDTEVDPFGHIAIEAAAEQRLSAEYIDGYEHCRQQVLAIFNDGVQRKRSEFISLITNLQP